MVESNSAEMSFKCKFINHDTSKGFTEYLIIILAPGNISFHINDRYSSMRNFYTNMSKIGSIGSIRGLPKFPSKKFLGNTKSAFLKHR